VGTNEPGEAAAQRPWEWAIELVASFSSRKWCGPHSPPRRLPVPNAWSSDLFGHDRQVDAAEMDEMWSFVGSKSQQRWLWHAIEHHTGQVLAYVFGTREDHVFLELKALLEPFGIIRFYTDGWGAYDRHIDHDKHTVGTQYTQKIERKHTTLRARIKRLVRKTICFSKTTQMHDLVIGLFINRFAYGRAVWIIDQLIW
jgi:insertion element IS1 protein InsB